MKTDPYLQMLQRRSVSLMPATTAAASGAPLPSRLAHPNSAYVAPAQVAQYTERKNRSARWRVVDAEFYDETCSACSAVHVAPDSGAKGAMLSTMAAMMSTFGDADRPCVLTVQLVKTLGAQVAMMALACMGRAMTNRRVCASLVAVGESIRRALAQLDADELSAGPGLRVRDHSCYSCDACQHCRSTNAPLTD